MTGNAEKGVDHTQHQDEQEETTQSKPLLERHVYLDPAEFMATHIARYADAPEEEEHRREVSENSYQN